MHLAYELRDTPIKVNAIHPGYVQTDMNGGHGEISVPEGAKSSVEMALLAEDGPSGTFTHLGKPLPWYARRRSARAGLRCDETQR